MRKASESRGGPRPVFPPIPSERGDEEPRSPPPRAGAPGAPLSRGRPPAPPAGSMALETGEMTVSEIEFLAMESSIEIVPLFRHNRLDFISGSYGPFEPNVEQEVPLWLALTLKKRRRCRIKTPVWMQREHLQSVKELEARELGFVPMHYHYQEISNALFSHAKEDIGDADEVFALVEDIANRRQSKIRRGLNSLADDVHKQMDVFSVNLDNMGAMEIFAVRGILGEAMDRFIDFSTTQEAAAGASQRGAPGEMATEAAGAAARRLRRFRSGS